MLEQKREGLRLSHIWFLLAMLGGLLGACNLPLGRASIDIETPTPLIEATPPVSGVPTIDPTQATLQLAVYPPGTRTGWPDLDAIIDAVLAHDFDTLRGLTRYTPVGCTAFEALGGPPKCQADEPEGTIVEVVPLLGPGEGSHLRKEEYESWSGPDALGLLAVYRPSSATFSDENYPKGEFAIVFLDGNGISDLTLHVSQGKVVRFDFGIPGSTEGRLGDEAEEVLLPLSLNSIPTPVPWNRFDHARFSFLYPPTLNLSEGPGEATWRLGDQIEFFIRQPGISWVSCFDQSLGDCPFVEDETVTEINGLPVRRVKGYIGAVGGNTPQEFLTYIFTLEDEQLVFAVYALPFGVEVKDVTMIWPLEGMALELFERTVGTVTLQP